MASLYERSVIDMGQGSYIMTLPIPWVRYYGIKPGDKLPVVIDGDVLQVYPPRGNEMARNPKVSISHPKAWPELKPWQKLLHVVTMGVYSPEK